MKPNLHILRWPASISAPIDAPAMPLQPKKSGGAHPLGHRARAGDEIARLVQRVFIFPETPSQARAVVFCGVDEGAGCSSVCARAGEMLAERVPGTVCVIDANLRSPSLHEYFSVELGTGFADFVRDPAPAGEFTRATSSKHLHVMTAGAVGKDSNGALNPARLRARLSELRAEFDYLLIDTPPANSYPDAILLGQLADGVILIVGSNSTRRESARTTKESLAAAKVPILGAVLNMRTYPIPEALYQRL